MQQGLAEKLMTCHDVGLFSGYPICDKFDSCFIYLILGKFCCPYGPYDAKEQDTCVDLSMIVIVVR